MDTTAVVRLSVALAFAVLLAGCSVTAPGGGIGDPGVSTETPVEADRTGGETVGTDEPVPTDTARSERQSEEGHTTGPINDTGLLVDENQIYNRTAALLASDADAPTVRVAELNRRVGRSQNEMFAYLGLTNESGADGQAAAAIARDADTVVINEALLDANRSQLRAETTRNELILAHEFTHTVQYEQGWSRLDRDSEHIDLGSTEGYLLYASLVEGGAVYTADRYASQFGLDESEIALFERLYRGTAPHETFGIAPYHHGGQYFDATLDSAANLATVYEGDLPQTTTEILHPEKTDFEPTPLNVTARTDREGLYYKAVATERMGEMFVHVALTAHLGTETADRAAAGYANDRLLPFGGGEASNYAWVTHWTDGQNATQFARAFNRSLAARTGSAADQIDVRFAGDRTVVVLAGDERFRDGVVLEGENTTLDVVVTDPGESSTVQTVGSATTPAVVRSQSRSSTASAS